MRSSLFFIFLSICVCQSVHGQSVQRRLRIPTSEKMRLDSLSIAPHTFSAMHDGELLDTSLYKLFPVSASIQFNQPAPFDSVDVMFQVLPFDFSAGISHKDSTLIGPAGKSLEIYIPGDYNRDPAFFSEAGLTKSGSISRGITFGNNQDLSVNSSLDLQLNGKLTDRISVLASVTDNNIPIQPDGNTQQLQDFDQVFIQLYNERFNLTAGDFQIRQGPGSFLKFHKRAQGATFSANRSSENGSSIFAQNQSQSYRLSAAVSKGKFARNIFTAIEGNQGPYRLTGAENESFIVVLAGTERVFIDGRLLERGLDRDYVIDYNSAELIFTATQPMTKDKRIVVEFQYSDKNYARSLVEASVSGVNGPATWFINLYSEQDSKNQPLQQDLTAEDKFVLGEVGDNLSQAYTNSVDSVGFADNVVLYALVDSLGYDSVLVHSNNESVALYRAAFSKVGTGNGDYIEDDFTAVGRVFRWIAPDTISNVIVHQGTHAPIIQLVAPRKRQMLTAGGSVRFARTYQAKVEGAMSNTDINTFSSNGNGDNNGLAFKIDLDRLSPVETVDSLRRWRIKPRATVQYVDQDFRAIERFRSVEFERNWNMAASSDTLGTLLWGGGIGLAHSANGFVGVDFESLSTTSNHTGYSLRTDNDIHIKKTNARFTGSWVETSGLLESQFIRHKTGLSYDFPFLRVGFNDEHELNRRTLGDSLLLGSYQFYDWEAFVGSLSSWTNSYKIFYRERTDLARDSVALSPSARARQYGVSLNLLSNRNSQLKLTASNRQLRIVNEELIAQAPEETFLGRLDHTLNLWKGFIQVNTFYQTGSGLQQKREFVYFEVPVGQGVYVWNDYNEDGVKDLDEFEIAQFSYEANYIRTFVQTSEYVKIYSGDFNQTLQITPARLKQAQGKVGKFVQRFSGIFSYRSERKTSTSLGADRFNPFYTAIADSDLVALVGAVRATLFFNRSHPKFGLEYTYQDNRNKSLLTNGFESRSLEEHLVRVRYNFAEHFSFIGQGILGRKELASDFLASRSYMLDTYSASPEFAWQPNTNIKVALNGRYGEKKNSFNLEQSILRKAGVTMRYSQMGKGSVQGEFNLLNVSYSGEGGTALAFEMLEGLQKGINMTWNLGVQGKVAKNLQLNVNYNGRRGESGRAIHQGGMQVRAFF
jgi:hypothetical protein